MKHIYEGPVDCRSFRQKKAPHWPLLCFFFSALEIVRLSQCYSAYRALVPACVQQGLSTCLRTAGPSYLPAYSRAFSLCPCFLRWPLYVKWMGLCQNPRVDFKLLTVCLLMQPHCCETALETQAAFYELVWGMCIVLCIWSARFVLFFFTDFFVFLF